MARWTDIATWRGNSPNHSSRGVARVTGMVVHTANGNGPGVVNWIMNSASKISATFVVMRDGTIYQTLDTDLKPWTTGAFNAHSISVECEGFFAESFTNGQISALAKILSKAHDEFGVKLKRSKRYGLSGHRQHMSTQCPGEKRYRQLQDVVDAALFESEDDMPTPEDVWTHKMPSTVSDGNMGMHVPVRYTYRYVQDILSEMKAGKKRQEAILEAVRGSETSVILERIDQRAAEDAERDAELLRVAQDMASGGATAQQVVDEMFARIGRMSDE